ncbi:MAG: TorF family putative porin [Alphaproteobacteria bacterium]|nr:TorF family putative porin [Alphaproteobacteria bacterium]
MKTSMWKAGLFGVVSMASLAPLAQAEEGAWGPVTGGAALTSDYRFRGISQSDRDAAVQGWLQYDHASGFFFNVWASSIDFNDAPIDSSVEVDFTAGYNFNLGPETTGSAKAVYYWYADADIPSGAPEYDYWELIGSVGHDFGKFSMTGEITYSPDYFLESGDAWALTGGVAVPVMDTFLFFTDGLEASAHVGHQWFDAGVDYMYYDFGATASWGQFALDVRWVDADLNTSECGFTQNCEGGIVLTVSAELPG